MGDFLRDGERLAGQQSRGSFTVNELRRNYGHGGHPGKAQAWDPQVCIDEWEGTQVTLKS